LSYHFVLARNSALWENTNDLRAPQGKRDQAGRAMWSDKRSRTQAKKSCSLMWLNNRRNANQLPRWIGPNIAPNNALAFILFGVVVDLKKKLERKTTVYIGPYPVYNHLQTASASRQQQYLFSRPPPPTKKNGRRNNRYLSHRLCL